MMVCQIVDQTYRSWCVLLCRWSREYQTARVQCSPQANMAGLTYLELAMTYHLHKLHITYAWVVMNHNIGWPRRFSVFCLVFQGIQESGFLRAE
jgi:hypothetical protein